MPAKHPTESFRLIPGFDGYYRVSDMGRVQTRKTTLRGDRQGRRGAWRDLIPAPSTFGHLYLNLCKNGKMYRMYIHKLVLELFVGPRAPGQVTRHLNGIETDNRLENLAYGTPRDNYEDSRRHGTAALGSRAGCAKLTEDQVVEIRRLRSQGYKYSDLVKMFGTCNGTMCSICLRKTWVHVP